MITLTSSNYTLDWAKLNPDFLIVFGENEMQQGSKVKGGGQAIIRPADNAFGFCTLESIGKFWSDKTFPKHAAKIEQDIAALHEEFKKGHYKVIVFPKYGLGTGRASMTTECPRVFLHLSIRLLDEFGFNNIKYLSVKQF